MGRLFSALLLFALFSAACDQNASQPIAFSRRAYLGETISLPISSDSAFTFGNTFTLSKENVVIRLWDQGTDATYDVAPRAVVVGTSAAGTLTSEQDGATEVSIAIFDLPSTLPPGFDPLPSSVRLIPLLLPGMTSLISNVSWYPTLEILGNAAAGEGPTVFYPGPPAAELQLEALPSLRLRARRPQFHHSWTIGSVAFEVKLLNAAVSNPRAYARITASRALAYATPIAADRIRVILVDPVGFKLVVTSSPSVLGSGPFVDVVFDQSAPFSASDFEIENLVVTRLDGTILINDPGNSEEFFELYVRANQ